jgi:hypothetical protein
MHPWSRFHKSVRPNLSRNCGRQAARLSVAAKKFDRISLKNDRKLLQHVDRCCMLLAFQHADVVSIDARTIGKLLLRQVFDLAQPAKVRRNGLLSVLAKSETPSLQIFKRAKGR